jgi:hypothetical protein
MAASIVSSNLTSGFIDLATFDELEKYMYGGKNSITYFVRETRKSTWFTQVPTVLSRGSGTADFGQEWSANISRAGDYLLQVWLRVTLPSVGLKSPEVDQSTQGKQLRWTLNLMHNLIRESSITFNDLSAARLDNFFLDFWAAFTVPAGKQIGYDRMIGNIPQLTGTTGAPGIAPAPAGQTLPEVTLNLPLPYFFTRDSGVALPTAALPYNEMRLQFWLRNWNELLIMDNVPGPLVPPTNTNPSSAPLASQLVNGEPHLTNVYVWANYAIVSNDERKRMGCAPRDILIEQVQTAPVQTYAPATVRGPSYDIRFSHAIKALFFAVRNNTTPNQWSVYTTTGPFVQVTPGDPIDYSPTYNLGLAVDPILNTTLIYENTQRLSQMGSDYFSLVQPYYQPSAVIPVVTGYHMYSYSLDFLTLDPMGSTNYGKLTNVSVVPYASQEAVNANSNPPLYVAPPFTSGAYQQTYQFVCVAVNNNIIRISGGALGKNSIGKPRTGRCQVSCVENLFGKTLETTPVLCC